jgi:hypothetical protein
LPDTGDSHGSERRHDMAVTPLFTCVCGIQKKTTNHWVLAKVTGSDIRFMPWDSKLALRDDIIVLCGEGCATALLSRSLGEWKNAAGNETAKKPEMAVA